MNRFLIAFALLLATPFFQVAAEPNEAVEKVPLPAGPVLKRAPEVARWTITFSYPKSAKGEGAASSRLKTLMVTKSNDIYLEQKTYSDGSQRESWHVGNLQVVAAPGAARFNVYDPSCFGDSMVDPSLYTDYSTTDFPALAWVSAQNYLGLHGPSKSLIFQQSIQSLVPELGWGPTLLTACIDLNTRMPVWVQSREAMLTYQFNAPPQAALALPPDVRQLLDKRAKAVKMLTTSSPSF